MPATLPLEPPPTAAALRARFDAVEPLTVGIEEELMLLDPATLDLAPLADELLERLGGDPRFKRELPAAQLEIATTPAATAHEALAQLAGARADLHEAAAGLVLPAAAGAHPFAATSGPLNDGERYDAIRDVYGPLAQRQLIAACRCTSPSAAPSARSPSTTRCVRTCRSWPRWPPTPPSTAGATAAWRRCVRRSRGCCRARGCRRRSRARAFAAELRWGAAAGAVAGPGMWWWELRPHPAFGTLELRVPDAQTTLADAAGVVAVAQALVAWLAERWDAGELPPAPAPSWRIAENRFAALRFGLDGELADLASGEREPTRERLRRLLDALEPVATRLGGGALLAHARALAQRNGAIRQREVAAQRGVRGLVGWMAERFADPLPDAQAPAARVE